ncbi:MAG: NAD-binding protein [Spirochaetaceae bacterium]|jgi:trk system potassium uptake protein TrkA|nr:NAD-binding protein [Spirochaetaceae bacterium]
MNIVIVGAGMTGTALARNLTQNKHLVSIIESNEERARHVSNRLDCMVINAEGNDLAALEEAGIEKAGALVCVTGFDEVNMIICGIAASRFPNLFKIARVRSEEYIRFTSEPVFGVNFFVHPNIEASRAALAAIEHNAAGDVLSFAGTEYELGSIEINGGSAFDGLNLKDYRSVVSGETLVTLLERKGECILPSGSTVLKAGDRVHILANDDEMDMLFELGGRKEGIIRKIGVVGGGQTGALIVEGLLFRDKQKKETKKQSFFSFFKGFILKRNRKIVIIEQDYSMCKELSARFPEAVVLNEDISDENFIQEDEINGLDLIITTTGNQELNIITALYLKSAGVKRAIAMVSSDSYAAIARRLGIDVVIPIKSVLVDSILGKLLSRNIRAVHRLGDGSISVFEIVIPDSAPVDGMPITEFKLPHGGLVMLVERGGESFIPRGGYVFKTGDRIVISAKKGNEKEIERLFGIAL